MNAAEPKLQTIFGQPSWTVRSRTIELAITELGGHMAPVTFCREAAKPIQPYYISPWQEERLALDEPVLVPLRGDFFCLPFGANAGVVGSERHRVHGEPAGTRWRLAGVQASGAVTTLTLSMQTQVRPGRISKRLTLVDGHNVVYCQHVVEGYRGRLPLGHHATLRVPDGATLRITTSPFQFGMTPPTLFSNPLNREYQSLAVGAKFTDLQHVPTLWKQPPEADCSVFPARPGYTDLLAIFSRTDTGTPAWTAAAVPEAGYLWFALRDPRILPATVFWMCDHGRHGPPWNGRNRCLGLEDVCGYFAEGVPAALEPNVLTQAGIATAVELSPERPVIINYIEGVVPIPPEFERVQTVEFAPEQVAFVSTAGHRVRAPVRHEFLARGAL